MTAKILKHTLTIVGLLYIAIYLGVASQRLTYPFELECMEAGALHQVVRAASHQQIYVRPTLDYTPMPYTPLYFYLSAAASVFGGGFLPLRLVSFISSLFCLLFIFLLVRHETGHSFYGVLAAALYAATYPKSGAWFDVGRVDSLFLAFFLFAVYCLRVTDSDKSSLMAAVMLSLSFLTKQTAVIMTLPLLLYYLLTDRRRFFHLTTTTIIIIGGSVLLFNYLSGGWFNFYVFDSSGNLPIPGQDSIVPSMWIDFWTKDLGWLIPALGLTIFYLFSKHYEPSKKKTLFYFLFLPGMIGASWISRLHVGGYANGLLPAYASIAIMFGLGLNELINKVPSGLMKTTAYSICLVQFALLVYNPQPLIPTKMDQQAGRELVKAIKQIKGEVFIPHHPYLAVMAGKDWSLHYSTILNLNGGFGGGIKKEGLEITEALKDAISNKRYAAIILDFDPVRNDYIYDVLNQNYSKSYLLYQNNRVFLPVSGMPARPSFIFTPKT